MSHIHIQHYFTDEDKEIIIDCLEKGFPFSFMIGADNSSVQPEITEKQVMEYCEKRSLVVIDSNLFHSLTTAYERGRLEGYQQGFRDATVKSKAEDYRWNGGGNY